MLTIGPEAWSNYRQLARTLTNQGMPLKTSGRLAESLTVFRMAIILWEWMSEQMPYAGRLRSGLSLALLNAGHVEVELGRPAKGEPGLQQALRILEKLQEAAPLDPEYQSSLLRAKGYLGEDFFVRGRTDHAVNLLHEAIQMGEALPKPWDNDRLLRTDRARFLYVLGCVEAERGHFTPALRSLREAEQQQGQMLAKAPADYSFAATCCGPASESATFASKRTRSTLRSGFWSNGESSTSGRTSRDKPPSPSGFRERRRQLPPLWPVYC